MRYLYSASALTLLLAMPDEGGGGGSEPLSLEAALKQLDPDNAELWTADGLAKVAVLEGLTGRTDLSREEIDKFGITRETALGEAGGQPAPEPQEETQPNTSEGQRITRGRLVDLTFAEPFDGEDVASGIVVKVNDDGTVNVKALAPNGGADRTFTGVFPTAYVDAMIDGADKNARRTATWDWPRRD